MASFDNDDLASRLERLEAYGQIRALAFRYAAALDRRDIGALTALYAEEVKVSSRISGRAALRAQFESALRQVRITILFVGNHVIEFDSPSRAHGSVYCRAEVQTDARTWISQAIHYSDRYVRQDEWRFAANRRHELFYGVEHGYRPVGQSYANWPVHDVGRGTLPQRWPTWQRFWSETTDAPG
jgi:ketosteroid isomerase-like protein